MDHTRRMLEADRAIHDPLWAPQRAAVRGGLRRTVPPRAWVHRRTARSHARRQAGLVFILAAGVALAASTSAPRAALAVAGPDPSPLAAQDDGGAPELYDDTVVRDVTITFEQSGDWTTRLGCNRGRGQPGGGGSPAPGDERARLVVDGVVLDPIGVRCKGNSSLGINGSKKPLNLTMDAFVEGQDLWGYDVVNLNNNFNDPSQLREALALRALGSFMPAPRFTFARVTVQGEYLGLYTMVEQINGEFADHWYPQQDDGLIIKGDSPIRIQFDTSGLTWEGEALDAYKQNYEVKGKAADSDDGYVLLRELTRALDGPESAGGLSDAEFPEGVRDVLDVDSALWYLAGNNVLANFDSYYVGKNYYLYRGESDERFRMIPWDLGLSYGIFGLRGSGQTGPPQGTGTPSEEVGPFAQIEDPGRPLIRRLLPVPTYRADYLAHYRDFAQRVMDTEWVATWGQGYQDLIRDAVADEVAAQGSVAGAFTFAQFEANLESDITTGGGRGLARSIPGIQRITGDRSEYLGGLAELARPDVQLEAVDWSPEAPTAADPVQVTADFGGTAILAGVELRYRVDGSSEQIVGMQAGADGNWLAVIPAQRTGRQVSFVFRVGVSDGRAAFFPAANRADPYAYEVTGVHLPRVDSTDLVLNEFLAANDATNADAAGDFDDWVELYNRGDRVINLAGYFLSDDPEDPWAFAMPAQDLEPGGHLLIWCDRDTDQGPDHAAFQLSRGGESVVLATDQAIVDEVDYEEQLVDVSYGRTSDGDSEWLACGQPTPGSANRCDGTIDREVHVYLPIAVALP